MKGSLGLPNSTTCSRPSGFSTRRNSASASRRTGADMWCSASEITMRSTEPAASGRACASPWRNSTWCGFGFCRAAWTLLPGSTAMTRAWGAASAMARACVPVPAPTSRMTGPDDDASPGGVVVTGSPATSWEMRRGRHADSRVTTGKRRS